MFQTNMVTHLWDLVDEGLESVLDCLHGGIGVTGLCVPVATGPGRHLRYGAGVVPRVFQTRGGVFFPPNKARYERTRCKPISSGWLRSRDPLRKLSELCRERGLGLRAVIECTNTGRIAAHDAHFAQKNVFGDVSRSQVCLANADVAEFVRALSVDVSSTYAIDTVELTGLAPLSCSATDSHQYLSLGAQQLLALCFCESCMQSAAEAGVDVESAARSATVRLDTVFRTGQPIETSLAALADDDPPLCSFLAWYRDRIAALVSSVGASCNACIASHARLASGAGEEAIDPGYTRGANIVVLDFFDAEIGLLERTIGHLRGTLVDEQRLEAQLSVTPPAAGDDQALVRNLTRVAESGIPSANLDHYGRLPRDHVDLVKQAIRFARRTFR